MKSTLYNKEMKETKLGLKKYKKLVQRTCPTLGWAVTETGNKFDCDYNHHADGIASELFEELPIALRNKDKVNIGEELADAEWYACNLATHLGISLLDIYPPIPLGDMTRYATDMLVLTGRLIDYHKKAMAYGKKYPKNSEIKPVLEGILTSIQYAADQEGIDLPEMRLRVIKKLYKRYPDGFSSDKALLRDLGIERAVLEGGE